jgi:DNA excision repair protein ERCC-2
MPTSSQAESIVVFDEAHNIDNVCIEALSVTLDKRTLDESVRSVGVLQRKVAEMKASDSQRLAREVGRQIESRQALSMQCSALCGS